MDQVAEGRLWANVDRSAGSDGCWAGDQRRLWPVLYRVTHGAGTPPGVPAVDWFDTGWPRCRSHLPKSALCRASGVFPDGPGRYRAAVVDNRRQHTVGRFSSLEAAEDAVKAERRRPGDRPPGSSSMTLPRNYSIYLSREESRIGGQDDEASRPAPSDVTVIDPARPDRCSTGPRRYRRR